MKHIAKTKRSPKKTRKSSPPYFVYIIECQNASLYTGITTDIARRFKEHQSGTGARYTRAQPVKRVAYFEKHRNRSTALKREAAIKRLPRLKKLALFA